MESYVAEGRWVPQLFPPTAGGRGAKLDGRGARKEEGIGGTTFNGHRLPRASIISTYGSVWAGKALTFHRQLRGGGSQIKRAANQI